MRVLSLLCILGLPLAVLANDVPTHSDYADPLGRYTYTPADPFNITWLARAPLPADGVSRAAAAWGSDGKYHLVCGNCQTHTSHPNERVYDPGANSWADGLDRPGGGVHNHDAEPIGTKIYVGGGSSGSGTTDDFTVIDLVASTWTTVGQIPVASNLYYEFAAGGNGRLYMAGGATGGTAIHNQMWEYDPVGNAWSQKANLPANRRDVCACGVGDTIYIGGGCATYPTGLNTFWKYSISGDSYTNGPNMPAPFFWGVGMVATSPDSGPQIYFCGGQQSSGYLRSVYRYNIMGGYWVTEDNLISARRSHGGDADGRYLYCFSGWNGGFMLQCERGQPDFVGIQEPSDPHVEHDNLTLTTSPNPFSKRTTITYNLPASKTVDVSLFDTNGKLVKKLVAGKQSAGSHKLICDGQELNCGVYFVCLTTDEYTKTTKLIIAR